MRKNQMVIVVSVPGFSVLLCVPWLNDLIWMIYSYTQYFSVLELGSCLSPHFFKLFHFSFMTFLWARLLYAQAGYRGWSQVMGCFRSEVYDGLIKSSPHTGVIYKNTRRNYGSAVSQENGGWESGIFEQLMGVWAWFLCGNKKIYMHSSASCQWRCCELEQSSRRSQKLEGISLLIAKYGAVCHLGTLSS